MTHIVSLEGKDVICSLVNYLGKLGEKARLWRVG